MADYRDPLISTDASGITVRRYYFPFATSKHTRWTKIHRYERAEMSGMTGRYRIWGSGNLRTYYNLDPQRPNKSAKFVLDLGGWFRPALTPDDPDAFAAALAEHTAG